MTDDIRRFGFLLRQVPICTQSPLRTILGPERHRELRAKYKLELGLDLLDDRCSNVFNCKAIDDGCAGRPFPIDDEIRAALDSLNVTVTTGNFKGRDVYFAQAVVTCQGCPFNGQCEAVCATQDSFISRSTKPESNPPESSLVPYEDYEKGMYKALTPEDVEHCSIGEWSREVLPLDCLTPKQRQVIEMTLYEGLEQSVIASRLGTSKQDVSQTYKLAYDRLFEFGRARDTINKSSDSPTVVVEYYVGNMTQSKISSKYSISQSRISQIIAKWRVDNDI